MLCETDVFDASRIKDLGLFQMGSRGMRFLTFLAASALPFRDTATSWVYSNPGCSSESSGKACLGGIFTSSQFAYEGWRCHASQTLLPNTWEIGAVFVKGPLV